MLKKNNITVSTSTYCTLEGFSAVPDASVDAELYASYRACMARLVYGDENKALNKEIMHGPQGPRTIREGLKVLSARVDNKKARALFIQVKNPFSPEEEKIWILESVTCQHYEDVPYLRKGNMASAQTELKKRLSKSVNAAKQAKNSEQALHLFTRDEFDAPSDVQVFALAAPLYHDGLQCVPLGSDQLKILSDVKLGKSGPVLLEGGPGTGKTTDLKLLRDSAESGTAINFLSLNPKLVNELRTSFLGLYENNPQQLSAPVSFRTCDDMLLSVGGDANLRAEEDFEKWFLARQQNKKHFITAGQAYREVLLIHGQVINAFLSNVRLGAQFDDAKCASEGLREYVKLGERETFVSKEKRNEYFDVYTMYISILKVEKSEDVQMPSLRRLDLHLQAANASPYCIILDEMQDASPGLLAFLNACAQQQLIMAGNEAQALFMPGMSSIDWAKRMITDLKIINLNESYRNSRNITQFMRYIKAWRYTYLGGVVSKGESEGYSVASDESNSREGQVVVLKTPDGLLPEDHKHFCPTTVIIDDQSVDKGYIQDKRLSYSVMGYKGLECAEIMVSMILNAKQQKALLELNTWLSDRENDGEPITMKCLEQTFIRAHRGKNKGTQKNKSDILKLLNYMWTAYSRGRDKLVVVWPDDLAMKCRKVYGLVSEMGQACKNQSEFSVTKNDRKEMAIRNIRSLISQNDKRGAQEHYTVYLSEMDPGGELKDQLFGKLTAIQETTSLSSSVMDDKDKTSHSKAIASEDSSSTLTENLEKRKKKNKKKKKGKKAHNALESSPSLEQLADSAAVRLTHLNPLDVIDRSFFDEAFGPAYVDALVKLFRSDWYQKHRFVLAVAGMEGFASLSPCSSGNGWDVAPKADVSEISAFSRDPAQVLAGMLSLTTYINRQTSDYNESNDFPSEMNNFFSGAGSLGALKIFLNARSVLDIKMRGFYSHEKPEVSLPTTAARNLKILAGSEGAVFMCLFQTKNVNTPPPILFVEEPEDVVASGELLPYLYKAHPHLHVKLLSERCTFKGSKAPLIVHIEKNINLMMVHLAFQPTVIMQAMGTSKSLLTGKELLTSHAPYNSIPLIHKNIMTRISNTEIKVLKNNFSDYIEKLTCRVPLKTYILSWPLYADAVDQYERCHDPLGSRYPFVQIIAALDDPRFSNCFREYKTAGLALSPVSSTTRADLSLLNDTNVIIELIEFWVKNPHENMHREALSSLIETLIPDTEAVFDAYYMDLDNSMLDSYISGMTSILWHDSLPLAVLSEGIFELVSSLIEDGLLFVPTVDISKETLFKRLGQMNDFISVKAFMKMMDKYSIVAIEAFDLKSSDVDIRSASREFLSYFTDSLDDRMELLNLVANGISSAVKCPIGKLAEIMRKDDFRQLFHDHSFPDWIYVGSGNTVKNAFTLLVCPFETDDELNNHNGAGKSALMTIASIFAKYSPLKEAIRLNVSPEHYYGYSISNDRGGMSFSNMFSYHLSRITVWWPVLDDVFSLKLNNNRSIIDNCRIQEFIKPSAIIQCPDQSFRGTPFSAIIRDSKLLMYFLSRCISGSTVPNTAELQRLSVLVGAFTVGDCEAPKVLDHVLFEVRKKLGVDEKYSKQHKALCKALINPFEPEFCVNLVLLPKLAGSYDRMAIALLGRKSIPTDDSFAISAMAMLDKTKSLFGDSDVRMSRIELLSHFPERCKFMVESLSSMKKHSVNHLVLKILAYIYFLARETRQLSPSSRAEFIGKHIKSHDFFDAYESQVLSKRIPLLGMFSLPGDRAIEMFVNYFNSGIHQALRARCHNLDMEDDILMEKQGRVALKDFVYKISLPSVAVEQDKPTTILPQFQNSRASVVNIENSDKAVQPQVEQDNERDLTKATRLS